MKFFNNRQKVKKENPQKPSKLPTWQLTVSGIVQGVGFRWSVQTFAQNLHLSGSVRNNSDQTVTIILQCSFEDLTMFMQKLPEIDTPYAKITEIKKEKLSNVGKLDGFHVLY